MNALSTGGPRLLARGLPALAVCAAWCAPVVGVADAAEKTSEYTYATASDTKKIDPIGLVFLGPRANAQEVRASLGNVMGWGNGENSSSQWFKGDGSWRVMQAENASGCGACTREHIRLGTTPSPKYVNGQALDYTIGTPHHDQKSTDGGCGLPYGHVARRFNGVRDSIASRYASRGRRVTSVTWGNTALVKQCDGSWVGSADGIVKYIWTL